jgi:hypothetical protein
MAEKVSKIVMVVFLLGGAIAFFAGMLGESYGLMIYLSYIYGAIAIIGALAGAVMGAMAKPDSIKGSAIGIIAMLVILGVSYALASGEVMTYYPEGTTSNAVRWSGTGLYMLYILTILSVLSIVYSGVAKILNR